MALRICGDSISENCLKVKWTADRLGLAYDWIETKVLTAKRREPRLVERGTAALARLETQL